MKNSIITNRPSGRASLGAPILPHSTLQAIALIVVAVTFTGTAFTQTWQTVDDFQYGSGAQNTGLAAEPGGTLFAAGYGNSTIGYRGLIRASVDGGSTWSLLGDFLYPGLNSTLYTCIASDSAGNLYAAGAAYDDGTPNGGPDHWIVRRSTDSGLTWSTVDDFVPGGILVQANAIAVDSAGNVYVAGDAGYANAIGNNYWTVRKGIGGTNFTTMESLATGDSANTAQAILVHPTAGIFVAGEFPVIVNKFGGTALEWTVRRSTNGGAGWATVDTFAFTSKSSIYRAEAHGIGVDSLGNLYVVGRAAAPNKPNGSGYWCWVVRKGTSGGNSWTTVDDYQLSPTAFMWPSAIATDSAGNLYVAGYGDSHWLVRESVRGTGVWSTTDDFTFMGGAWASAIAANSTGNMFVGGGGNGSSSEHWLVRKR